MEKGKHTTKRMKFYRTICDDGLRLARNIKILNIKVNIIGLDFDLN
jgi:hypothetical protein